MAKLKRIESMTKGLMNLTGNVAKMGMGTTKKVTKGAGGYIGDMALGAGKAGQGFYAKKMRGK